MAVTDAAILKIKEMIVSGELEPGSRLPSENDLSDRLGLSRNSLREAVKALEVIRVLDVRRGDGTYVTSLQPELLLEAMSFVIDLHRDDSVLEILEVRRILEARAAGMAARTIGAESLQGLASLLDGVTAQDDVERLVAHDVDFHQAIADASGNGYLANLVRSLSGHTVRARIWRGITQEGAIENTIAEHRRILAALRSGDSELTEALMTAHLAGVEQWLKDTR